jgi:fluoroacetyl-CoA thioesterase
MKETLKPGLVVTVSVKLIEVDRWRLVFEVSASDGIDVVSKGIHERFVIDAQKFTEKLSEKTSQEVSS